MTELRSSQIGQLATICFIQVTSTISFAVFYSGLSIYLTQNRNFSQMSAAYITGLFLSFNYFLPLTGGMIANKFISYKNLYLLGILGSIVGCLCLTKNFIYLGLSLYLLSSLSNVCLKMFVTQLFSHHQQSQRRIAFIWNYIAINLGFMLGFLLTGFFTLINNYSVLFSIMSSLMVLTFIVATFFINEPLLETQAKNSLWRELIIGSLVVSVVTVTIDVIFHYANLIQSKITFLIIFLFLSILYYGFRKCKNNEIESFIKFIYFCFFGIIFRICYMLTPVAMIQFIQYDVQRNFLNINLAPQWFSNISSIVILIFAPTLTFLIKKINLFNNSSNYFSLGFICLLSGFSTLFLGFHFLANSTKMPLLIILIYLLLITFSEVFISPISDSIIGELVPESLRGLMIGINKVTLCIGVLISSILANDFVLPNINKSGLTLYNNLRLEHFFFIASCLIGFALLLIPLLTNSKKKINESNKQLILGEQT